MFESSDPAVKVINATDSRFFWIALYAQPLLWVLLAVVAIFALQFIWLTLVGKLDKYVRTGRSADSLLLKVVALSLTITNTLAFSRCDKFGQASNLAGSAFSSGNMARNVAGGMIGRFFTR